jgi:oxygen-independent coproporphyrinogen-3 oxidase
VISRDPSKGAPFVDAILRELDLKIQRFHKNGTRLNLKELHLGGGTPTWLPSTLLEKLILGIQARFTSHSQRMGLSKRDISIEVDPRTFTLEHAKSMQKCRVTRVSLGVQDFHAETLKAIKRVQSYDLVAEAVAILRDNGVSSLNFDLVYGLPYQTQATMLETIIKVKELKPARIALYSYAHIPQVKLAQQGVEKHGLPTPCEKRGLYEVARGELLKGGYFEVGMDHFALPTDELYVALQQGRLHRNFMGYTVQKTQVLLGLGPSSLSDTWYAFSQNEKNVEKWLAQIEKGDIVPQGGHLLNADDILRRKIILDLMCKYEATLEDGQWKSVAESSVVRDDLLTWDNKRKTALIMNRGRPFVRNICSEFDAYLHKSTNKQVTYSRAI